MLQFSDVNIIKFKLSQYYLLLLKLENKIILKTLVDL